VEFFLRLKLQSRLDSMVHPRCFVNLQRRGVIQLMNVSLREPFARSLLRGVHGWNFKFAGWRETFPPPRVPCLEAKRIFYVLRPSELLWQAKAGKGSVQTWRVEKQIKNSIRIRAMSECQAIVRPLNRLRLEEKSIRRHETTRLNVVSRPKLSFSVRQ
jgi:hypothetical protein